MAKYRRRHADAEREHGNMTPGELKSARKSYGYIPARLVRVSDDDAAKLTWKSLKLDMECRTNGRRVIPKSERDTHL
jgi:hypothetical protein